MLEKISVFALAFTAGSAIAGPVGNVLGNVTGLLNSGASAPATIAMPKLPALPLPGLLGSGSQRPLLSASSSTLPGLGGASATEGPLGVTLLQEGADGSGYDYVLNSDQLQPLADALSPLTNDAVSESVLNTLTTSLLGEELVTGSTLLDSDHFIDDGLDNNLVTPLLGVDGDGGYADVAILDGNGTANAGPDGLLSTALISGSNTGNGGAIAVGAVNEGFSGNGSQVGVGVLNDGPVSGNGGQIGIGVLSGQASGNGGALGVGALNNGDLLHVCGGGTCGSAEDVFSQAGAIPQTELLPGVVLGGGDEAVATGNSNPLLNAGVLTGDDVANGGLLGVGVLAGDDSAQADLLGVCVLCGDNTAKGSLAVAALSGASSGNGGYTDASTLPVGIGVGALNDGLSGNGSDIGIGALNGVASGNGGILGASVLNGAASGNGGSIGAGVLSGPSSGNGGDIGVGAINGGSGSNGGGGTGGGSGGSGGGGTIGVGVIGDGGNGGGGGGGGGGDPTGPGANNGNSADAAEDGMCALEVRDGKGRLVQALKRPCKQLAKVKARTKA